LFGGLQKLLQILVGGNTLTLFTMMKKIFIHDCDKTRAVYWFYLCLCHEFVAKGEIMSKIILEIYDKENDTWSRIENGNWKNEKQLDEHILNLKKQYENSFYFKCTKNQTNIPENYKYTMFDYYERYPSVEKRNQAVGKYYERCGVSNTHFPLQKSL
jgi:hypothetical protein